MNLWKAIILSTVFIIFGNTAISKEPASNNLLNSNFIIDSKALSRSQEIQVHLPDDYYTNSSRKYPVMYVMDGDWYFLHGVAYQKSLDYIDRTPDFIVIGINVHANLEKRQNLVLDEKWSHVSSSYIDFLSKELIPHIDKKFRVLEERLYFGWEIMGALGADIIAQQPALFKGYILASPTLLNDERINAIETSLASDAMQDKFIYFTVAPVESWAIGGTSKLAKRLETKAPNNLIWQYHILEGEDHYSTPDPTIYFGLKTYFSDYPPIRFYSLQEYTEFGGLPALYEHYKKRGQRYNISTEIHPDTEHYLFVQTLREKNFTLFNHFFNEFEDHIETYIWYINDDLYTWYGEFCLENKKPDLAVTIYNIGNKRVPNSAKINNGLGDAYRMKKDYKHAMKYYQKAVEIAKLNSEPELAEYQAKLNELKQ